jgi:probable F420-dependent oxidoreductase
VQFGLLAANTWRYATGPGAASLARAAEEAGFDSLWTADHVLWPDDYASPYPYDETGKMPGTSETPLPDPLIWMTWAAANSSTIKLATGILILPQRNPAILAKELATLDDMAGGRIILGIGIGWLKEEFDALGVPFKERAPRTDEAVAVMRALWAGDRASFDGRFTSFTGMSVNPKPPSGSVPIVVGGHSRAAAERAGRLGDGFFPMGGDLPELVDIMRQTAAAHDRDPMAIEITTSHEGLWDDDPTETIEMLESWGVDRALIHAYRMGRGPVEERCHAWAERFGIR